LVISRWTVSAYWLKWFNKPRRIELNEQIEKHLDTKTEYNVYRIGLWKSLTEERWFVR